MNSHYAFWIAYETEMTSANPNNMIDLLMDKVDLFELFSEAETEAEENLPADAADCGLDAPRLAGLHGRDEVSRAPI